MYRADSFDQGARTVIDPATGLVQTQTLIPSTSNTYGALGIGISANGTKGDGTGEKKKKVRCGAPRAAGRATGTDALSLTPLCRRRASKKASLSAATGSSAICFSRMNDIVSDTSYDSRSGTVESPEWRKGPDGPKSLCNACGSSPLCAFPSIASPR